MLINVFLFIFLHLCLLNPRPGFPVKPPPCPVNQLEGPGPRPLHGLAFCLLLVLGIGFVAGCVPGHDAFFQGELVPGSGYTPCMDTLQ